MLTAPGIYFDVDVAEYHADPCAEPSVNQSLIKVLLEQSPAHARAAHPRLALPLPAEVEEENAEKYDKVTAIGDAFHGMLLGRGKKLAIGDYPTWQSKDAKEFRSDALEDGFVPILDKHHRVALAMYAAAVVQLQERDLMWLFEPDIGRSEVVLVWKMGEITCRTMIDRLSNDIREVVDLKTTRLNAAPRAIGSLMANAGWPIQTAMHELGLDTLNPENAGRRRHTYIVIEQYPPFALVHYVMTEALIHLGRKRLHIGLRSWEDCLHRGIWPAYPIEAQYPEMPGWIEKQWTERELEHEASRPHDEPPGGNILAAY